MDTDLLDRNSKVSGHTQMNPSFSRRTTNRDATENVGHLIMGEEYALETSLASTYQDNGRCLIIIL